MLGVALQAVSITTTRGVRGVGIEPDLPEGSRFTAGWPHQLAAPSQESRCPESNRVLIVGRSAPDRGPTPATDACCPQESNLNLPVFSRSP